MLENWIKPVESDEIEGFFVPPLAFGHYVRFEPESIPGHRTIALIGADSKWAKRVRRQLYQFSARNKQGMIYDLGDFRRLHPEFIVPALKELLAANICPIIIGARADLSLTFLHTLRQLQSTGNAVFMHESTPTWMAAAPPDSSLHIVGVQQHLLHPHAVTQAEQNNIGFTRLGQARRDLVAIEPLIRDAELMCMDMSAIRFSDMPAQSSHSTSGFMTEEACRIMRYAGMSPRIKGLALTGHDPMSMAHGQSANTVAQLIWYFIEGFDQRIQEYPGAADHFTQYMVHLKQYDFDLSFHKSEKSGRWWVEVPDDQGSKLFSCAYTDYQAACEEVVTERIFTCIDRS